MKSLRDCLKIIALILSLSTGSFSLRAQTNAIAAKSSDVNQHTIDKHARPVLAALHLSDADKEAKVRGILGEQIVALYAWHAKNDEQIKALWKEFNQARSKQDQAGADAALAKIDGVYASFKPQHEKFLSQLSSVLSPEQVETVKDALTINKVKVTFNAYQQIFHGLTDEQKAFILKNLKAAREEAMDANGTKEESAFFKKYKIKIEAYLTAQGYDVKQSYRDFVAKQKAEIAAKKAAKAAEEKQ